MFKKVFLIAAFIGSATLGYSQATNSIGPKIGFNYTSYAPKADSHDFLAGVNAGILFNHSINSNFGIMIEPGYSQMGSQVEFEGNIERLHYIQVPLSAVYYFGRQGEGFRPKIFAGPYLGFLMAATNKGGDLLEKDGAEPVHNGVDVGGQIGAGFNFRIKNETWLNTDVRYVHGFGDITKTAATNFQNVGLMVNVGVTFAMRK